MLSKIIAHAPTRELCINRMLRALDETVIEGIKSNKQLHKDVLQDEDFRGNNYSTNFLQKILK